jgi:hypothetical protein
MGDCRIRNCAFLHTRDVVCKFYLRTGQCARGDSCMYKHETPTPSPPNGATHMSNSPPALSSSSSSSSLSTATGAQTVPFAADVSSSPSFASIWSSTPPPSLPSVSLSSAVAAKPATRSEAPLEMYPHLKDSWSLATKLRLKELQEQYSHVPGAVVEVMFIEAGCRADVAAARLATEAPAPPPPPAAAAAAAANGAANDELLELQREQASAERALQAMQAPTIGWVATGDALNAEYKQKREAAIAAAVQRNRLFDLATKAYRRGDKKAARDLSAQGKRFQAEMEELHAEAAAGIFKARNSNGRADVLDLHGLHPDEAVEIVTKHVQTVRRDAKNRKERTFTLITGTGHHAASTAHRSKLRDAVVECLDRLHCLHRDTSPDQRGGMISVVVTNNNTPNSKKR